MAERSAPRPAREIPTRGGDGFERQQPLRADPLTGWNGSNDTNPQVRMPFQSKEAAIAYCEKHGLSYHIVPAPPVRLKLQAYADNFR